MDLLAQRKSLRLWIALGASEVLRPLTLVMFLTTRNQVYEQAGGAGGQAIRSAEQNESARIARRTRAEGGAAHGCAIPRRSVRQTNDVRAPRQRREDARPPAPPASVNSVFLTDQLLLINQLPLTNQLPLINANLHRINRGAHPGAPNQTANPH